MSGRLTESGQLATDIQIAGTEAEAIEAAQQVSFALSRLESRIGSTTSQAGIALAPCSMQEFELSQTQEALEVARSSSPEESLSVKALISEEQAAHRSLLGSWSGLLPKLDASANYYPLRPTGINQDIRWDVGLVASWTVFDGLIQIGRIREQAAQLRYATARLERERISKREDRSQLTTKLTSLLAQLSKIEPADTDSAAQFEKKKSDFSRGFASDLELLESAGLRARTRRLKSRYLFDAATAYYQLRSILAKPSQEPDL